MGSGNRRGKKRMCASALILEEICSEYNEKPKDLRTGKWEDQNYMTYHVSCSLLYPLIDAETDRNAENLRVHGQLIVS